MSVPEILQPLAERFGATASVKNVFGDPITAGEKTLIPVAKIAFGLGGGSGKRAGGDEQGGGGVKASPVGVIEITPQERRFIPVDVRCQLAVAALAGFGRGLLFAKWRR